MQAYEESEESIRVEQTVVSTRVVVVKSGRIHRVMLLSAICTSVSNKVGCLRRQATYMLF